MCGIKKKNSTIPRKKDKQQKLVLTRIETCCTSEMTSPLCVCVQEWIPRMTELGSCGNFKRRGPSGRSPRLWVVPLKEIINPLNVASLLPLSFSSSYEVNSLVMLHLPQWSATPSTRSLRTTGLPNCKVNSSTPWARIHLFLCKEMIAGFCYRNLASTQDKAVLRILKAKFW